MEQDLVGSRDEAMKGMAISTFLASTSLFFAGILMARIGNISPSIKVPIMLLFACVVSLTFAAVIYANVTGEIDRGESAQARLHMQTGNSLSEYLGLNIFIASLPLVIIAVTSDNMIRFTACLFSIGGLFLYTSSKMSLTNRALGVHRHLYAIFSLILLTLVAILQILGSSAFGWLSAVYLFQSVAMAVFVRGRL